MKKIIILLLVLSIGIGAGMAISQKQDSKSGATEKTEKKIAYWAAPMDKNYRRDKPGKSPMGMDLVPVYEEALDSGNDNTNAVKLSPAVINNLGVRAAEVKKGAFNSRIETVGYVDYDESKISHIHLRAEGWVEKRYVNSVGERIKKGDVLFEVYSPALVNAQGDYLNALSSGRPDIIRASKERLQALDISENIITDITSNRKTKQYIKIYAPQDGIISALNVVEGTQVMPNMTMVSLADLSSVWLLVDVFETQVSQMKAGLEAEVKLSYEPARKWKGKIAYIYPQIDPKTRTLKARLVFNNPDEALKPDMYANVTIFGAEKTSALSIPREALIRIGNSERVILALPNGRFQPAEVKSGIESGDRIEILSGLEEGEKIVTSAQFLIDSEASFTGSAVRMDGMKVKKEAPVKKSGSDVWGKGKVNAVISGERNKLNISHEPIAALKWPGMTMDFLAAPELDLSTLKAGQEIHFKIQKTPGGMYEIIQIMNMENMSMEDTQ